MTYTTLDRVTNEIKGTLPSGTAVTAQQVMAYARTVTNRIRRFGYDFEPQYAAKKITPTRQNTNTFEGLLSLNAQLLEVVSLTVGGTAYSYGTDILSEPDNGQTPIRTLRIADPWSGTIYSWYPCNVDNPASYYNSIVISGFWGVREFYTEQGFFDSGITSPVMTAAQTTIIVSAVTGPDAYNRTPMFSPGNLIRVDNELIEVVAVDSATKTLTLLRGRNGTTAAAHLAGTAIKVWEPEPDIVSAATRQTCLLYARRGSYTQTTTYPDGISVSYPSDLLAELRATIQRFEYLR
jgi:hypothetical protein